MNLVKFIGWAIVAPIIVYYFIEDGLTLQTPDQKLPALVLGVAGFALALVQMGK